MTVWRAGSDAARVGVAAEAAAAQARRSGAGRTVTSASGSSPLSVVSRPLGGSPPPLGTPRPSRAAGRRHRRRAALRASARASARTSASVPSGSARAPRHRGPPGAVGCPP